MKPYLVLSSIFLLPLNISCAENIEDSAGHEMVIANFDQESPACHVRLPAKSVSCDKEICEIPAPRSSSLKNVQLTLSCIPVSAPTGFENPPAGAKIFSIQTPSSKGHVSLIDEPPERAGERMRELYFCIYGSASRLCGFAKTLVLKDGESADASGSIIKILRTIVLLDGEVRK
jgi:hypothetical protein